VDDNQLKSTVSIDVTDIIKSVELALKNAPKKFRTASGAEIDQISAIAIVETLAAEIISTDYNLGGTSSSELQYITQILGNSHYVIVSLLSAKITAVIGNFTENDINGCTVTGVSTFGALTLTLR
jgi:hypothetical protein